MNTPAPRGRSAPALPDGGLPAGTAQTIGVLHELALRNPRDPARIEEEVLQELRRNPEAADGAFYDIPYEDRRKQETVHVTGLSIRAAETLGRAWGNLLANVSAGVETQDYLEMVGRVIILEPRIACFERPVRMAKVIKKRDGGSFELRGDKLAQAAQSCASKAMRNAILAALPEGIKRAYFKEAQRLVEDAEKQKDAGKPQSQRQKAFLARMAGVVEKFSDAWGLGQTVCEALVGKPFDEWTAADAVTLKGVWTSLEEGAQTPEGILETLRPYDEAREAATEALRKTARARGPQSKEEGPRCGGCGVELTPSNSHMTEAGWRCGNCAFPQREPEPPDPRPEEEEPPPVDPARMAGPRRQGAKDSLRRGAF